MNDKINIKLQTLEEIKNKLFNPQIRITDKIKQKRQIFLLKLPLFSLIYQKKGSTNFQIIVNNIRIVKTDFGEIIFDNDQNRTFNFILKGTVMLFTISKHDKKQPPKFFKKLTTGEYFGQKMQFSKQELESVRCVSLCYLLQLDMKFFYHAFAGHFHYDELRDKVNFLREIWIFNNMKRPILERILLSSEQKKYVRNHVLFKQGQVAQYLFVIIEGQLSLESIQDKKPKSFCVISRSQIYGAEEIMEDRQYQCTGICASDYIQILKIQKAIALQILHRDSFSGMIKSRKKLSNQLRERNSKSRRLLTMSSINETNRMQQSNTKKRYLQQVKKRTYSSSRNSNFDGRLDKQKILNELFNREIQLKFKETRRFRLEFIQENQKDALYNSKRISTLVNKDCTYEKEILLRYLERKQKKYHSALRKQLEFQQKQILPIPLLRVDRSSAVKNQKRKLKNSRKVHYTSLENL